MENLMEMEYTINGEKYVISATKADEIIDCTEKCTVAEKFPTMENFECIKADNTGLIQIPVYLLPEGMELYEWLGVIKEYGIILVD